MSARVDYAVLFDIEAEGDNVVEWFDQTLYKFGQKIIGHSQENYVPVDTGALRRSGFADPPQRQGDVSSVDIGFGGEAVDYAYVVHEAPPNWGQGKNKYLSKAITDMSSQFDEFVQREIGDA